MGGFHELWMFSLTYDIPDLNAKELVSTSYWPKYLHFQQQATQVDKKYFFSFFQMYLFPVRRKTDPCLTTQSGSKPFQFSKELPLSQLRIQSELFSKLTETFNLSFNIPPTTALCHRTWVWVWSLVTAQRTIHCIHTVAHSGLDFKLETELATTELKPRAGRSTEQYFGHAK